MYFNVNLSLNLINVMNFSKNKLVFIRIGEKGHRFYHGHYLPYHFSTIKLYSIAMKNT